MTLWPGGPDSHHNGRCRLPDNDITCPKCGHDLAGDVRDLLASARALLESVERKDDVGKGVLGVVLPFSPDHLAVRVMNDPALMAEKLPSRDRPRQMA